MYTFSIDNKRVKQINAVSGFYVTLLIFWTLAQILNILTYNNFLAQLGTVPAVALQSLYLIAWVVALFCGRRMGLNAFGYVGAGIMVLASILGLIFSLVPMERIMQGAPNIDHVMIAMNVWTGISTLLSMLGIFMFLIGARASWLLGLVTPVYFLLSLMLNVMLSSILGWMGVSFAGARCGCSIFMILFIFCGLLPIFLTWRRGALAFQP